MMMWLCSALPRRPGPMSPCLPSPMSVIDQDGIAHRFYSGDLVQGNIVVINFIHDL